MTSPITFIGGGIRLANASCTANAGKLACFFQKHLHFIPLPFRKPTKRYPHTVHAEQM